MIEIIEGDITEIKCQYIVHQCNATHNRNFGLSSSISKKFPYANLYCGKFAQKSREPGTNIVRGEGDQQKIIALIAQVNQGKPDGKTETGLTREQLFFDCMQQLATIPDIKEIALPYGIGCGYAGGNWKNYHKIIEEFSAKNPNINVKIVKFLQ